MRVRPALHPTLTSKLPVSLAGFVRGLPEKRGSLFGKSEAETIPVAEQSEVRKEEVRQKTLLHSIAASELTEHIAHLPAMITHEDGTYHFGTVPSVQP